MAIDIQDSHQQEEEASARSYDKRIIEWAEQFGFKTANLLFLQKAGFPVPAFKGIQYTAIVTHLDTYASGWRKLWEEFQKTQESAEKKMEEEGAPLSISPDAERTLETLQEQIRQTFHQHLFPLPQEGQRLEADHLMIRSTGNEDRVDVANPGGNASLVSENKPEHISQAIGEVIASYFSFKSMSQRLLSGEEVTKEMPKLACLAQILVGEKKEEKPNFLARLFKRRTEDRSWPPVSGAMYTRYPSMCMF